MIAQVAEEKRAMRSLKKMLEPQCHRIMHQQINHPHRQPRLTPWERSTRCHLMQQLLNNHWK